MPASCGMCAGGIKVMASSGVYWERDFREALLQTMVMHMKLSRADAVVFLANNDFPRHVCFVSGN